MEDKKENIEIQKDYYTKDELHSIINKKLLEFSTDLIARIDANKKKVEPKEEPSKPKSYLF